jgi:glyoxylase-like metal-dependent hydrolase (beta-lactamase superfamily II)
LIHSNGNAVESVLASHGLGYARPVKRLHRSDLFGWSRFDEARNLDFHSVLWKREGGNVVIDPLPLGDHDRRHLEELGGAAWILITNSDHVREARALAEATAARVAGPAAERATFPIRCDRWLGDGDEPAPGLRCFALDGSKTPGELAFLLDETTLIVGDLVRAHEGGRLCLLPDAKLVDPVTAREEVARLARLPRIEAVLTGDGWPVFRHGGAALREILVEA